MKVKFGGSLMCVTVLASALHGTALAAVDFREAGNANTQQTQAPKSAVKLDKAAPATPATAAEKAAEKGKFKGGADGSVRK